ncbi:hypothetical protein HMPREF0298_2322 [Corynebacterium lipophiloflavum DSM 44291]|uniref:Uncharacterized protein n=1 Tax=Corynebacterium lipophiloflavum (strain ATCC 700352 / DSM 44291 / CCUG 37336 / JCM 10383 / DMMZ 1944) TaxID=525263 RepID=C0XV52_CORLD|nr:hypothetical protein HMPREF0298_2322 [Corynebacterium lipophiloflavum DSM 44291]
MFYATSATTYSTPVFYPHPRRNVTDVTDVIIGAVFIALHPGCVENVLRACA